MRRALITTLTGLCLTAAANAGGQPGSVINSVPFAGDQGFGLTTTTSSSALPNSVIALDFSGDAYVYDLQLNGPVDVIPSPGDFHTGVTWDPTTDTLLWLTSAFHDNVIYRTTFDGTILGTIDYPAPTAGFREGLTWDVDNGTLWTYDFNYPGGPRVVEFTTAGDYTGATFEPPNLNLGFFGGLTATGSPVRFDLPTYDGSAQSLFSRVDRDGGLVEQVANPAVDPLAQFFPAWHPTGGTGTPTHYMVTNVGGNATLYQVTLGFDDSPQHFTTITVCNGTGQAAAALRMTFTGSGDELFIGDGMVVSPGCPDPFIASNGDGTDTVYIEWGVPCVPDQGAISFLVRSGEGPLSFASGSWLDENGQTIAPVDAVKVQVNGLGAGILDPDDEPVIKVELRYDAQITYGVWTKPPGQCWQRWCCLPNGMCCTYRMFICAFPTRVTRLLEYNGWCAQITPWTKLRFFMPANPWWLQVRTSPPPPDQPQLPPGGPPPERPVLIGDQYELHRHAFDIRNSDDGGMNFSSSADFASAFFEMFAELGVQGDDPEMAPVETWEEIIQLMAPGYAGAADALDPLVLAILEVLEFEPSPEVGALYEYLLSLQNALATMSEAMATGALENPTPFLTAWSALQGMGEVVAAIPANSARFENAAEHLAQMADGMQLAGLMVKSGLPTMVEKDKLLAGLMPMFHARTEHFAHAMLPHSRVDLALDMPSWDPANLAGARVVSMPFEGGAAGVPGSVQETSEQYRRITDEGSVQIPIMGQQGQRLVWIKPPTHLAGEVVIDALDGYVQQLELTPGDANGDNCIDATDLDLVLDDLGAGGPFADSVPPTDVNFDGIVDSLDVAVVQAGMGQCGAALVDCNDNGIEDAADISSGDSGDVNGNGVPDECESLCIGDTNGDEVVNTVDLVAVIVDWGTDGSANNGDVNGDGTVDVDDLVGVVVNWGDC